MIGSGDVQLCVCGREIRNVFHGQMKYPRKDIHETIHKLSL